MRGRQIEVFREVMRLGGISRAAEVLNISQPAVSRMIDSLATDVGFALFERQGRGITPTPEAHLLMREIDVYFLGLDRVSAAAAAIRETRRGQLRIGVMPALAMSLTPHIIDQIRSGFPDIQITLDVYSATQLTDLIGSGQLDLALAHLDTPRFDIEEIAGWDAGCVCVMQPDHKLATKSKVKLTDLANEPLILLNFGTSTAQKLELSFAEAGITPNVAIQAQPSYAAYFLAAHGSGVAIVDKLTADALAKETVVTRALSPALSYSFKLIRPTGVRPSLVAADSAAIARQVIDGYFEKFHNY